MSHASAALDARVDTVSSPPPHCLPTPGVLLRNGGAKGLRPGAPEVGWLKFSSIDRSTELGSRGVSLPLPAVPTDQPSMEEQRAHELYTLFQQHDAGAKQKQVGRYGQLL